MIRVLVAVSLACGCGFAAGALDNCGLTVIDEVPEGPRGGRFGYSTGILGDLDGNNVTDLIVGAPVDGEAGPYSGAVYILFLQSTGVMPNTAVKIASSLNGMPEIGDYGYFGVSATGIGDHDGDGVVDAVVGAHHTDNSKGAVHVLFLERNGTVKRTQQISSGVGGKALISGDSRYYFGASVANLGDLDGDGITDILVGAHFADHAGQSDVGAVYVLFLTKEGKVKGETRLSAGQGGMDLLYASSTFGHSVATLGPSVDGVDVIVGMTSVNSRAGAAWILRLARDGKVKPGGSTKIEKNLGNKFELEPNDLFGYSVSSAGDVDGDGVIDVFVGANEDDTENVDSGAV